MAQSASVKVKDWNIMELYESFGMVNRKRKKVVNCEIVIVILPSSNYRIRGLREIYPKGVNVTTGVRSGLEKDFGQVCEVLEKVLEYSSRELLAILRIKTVFRRIFPSEERASDNKKSIPLKCKEFVKELNSKEVNKRNVDNSEIEEEFKTIEVYREEMIKYRSECEFVLKSQDLQRDGGSVTSQSKRRFKLPKLEVTKFNGDVKNWIGFWGQIRKIHDDEDIADEDMFQYLLQSMELGSAARSLVESFPPLGANYQKVIDQLKTRYARDELLIEIYVYVSVVIYT
ncbi:hypothetical protein NQ317_016240 [Molorchus minor]|uniref:Uncharacterized protein n=1 Tax=Molorchus minor TaxID=1323400 RepID=A0ABQ9J131_9CUCU|nr:hypothetical protein NQ317_016240 [Molorchus minor]